LPALDQGSGKEKDRYHQNGQESESEQHGGQGSASANRFLQFPVGWIASDGDDDAPGNQRQERAEDKQTRGEQKSQQAEADEYLERTVEINMILLEQE
jgi:hypothetical protein